MRSLPLVLPLLAACTTITPDDYSQLASFQRNAGLYFEGGKYDQALGLVERGLEIDPYDYKLRSIRASIHLRLSAPAAALDHPLLDQSLEEFHDVYSERSVHRHDRHLLFYYSLARQKQGLRLLAEAARLDPKDSDTEYRAAELDEEADAEFAAATDLLKVLLDRGDIPRLCQYHLLQIAVVTNDTEGILEHGRRYIEAAAADQEGIRQDIAQTTVYGYEQERKRSLETLRREEVAVRELLAQQLYRQRDFAAALEHVDAVLKIDPTRTDDHYNRGLILQELGRLDEAKEDMRTFLATTSLPPDSPKVVDAVQALTR